MSTTTAPHGDQMTISYIDANLPAVNAFHWLKQVEGVRIPGNVCPGKGLRWLLDRGLIHRRQDTFRITQLGKDTTADQVRDMLVGNPYHADEAYQAGLAHVITKLVLPLLQLREFRVRGPWVHVKTAADEPWRRFARWTGEAWNLVTEQDLGVSVDTLVETYVWSEGELAEEVPTMPLRMALEYVHRNWPEWQTRAVRNGDQLHVTV